MRDLKDYEQQYNTQPYERYQVYFRKKKIMEIIQAHKHNVLLEVGCGLESLFTDINTFDKFYLCEPAGLFYNKALMSAQKSKRKEDIFIYNKTIEDCVNDL